MKILFLSGLYPPLTKGGGELSTHYLAQGLISLGHQVMVATYGEQDEETSYEGVSVRRFNLPLGAKPLFEQWHAQKLARQLSSKLNWEEFDIIHAHDFRLAQVLSELKLKHSLVTARDYAQICGSPNNLLSDGSISRDNSLTSIWRNQAIAEASWLRKPFRIWQYRYNIKYRLASFKYFPYQIFISRAQREEIARTQDLSSTVTKVIYNPIDPSYLSTPSRQPSQEILFVGTVQKYKGVDLLLEAFQQLAKKNRDIYLTVVGEGATRSQYEKQVSRWGLNYRVRFTGRVPSRLLRDYYDRALVLVAPHLWVEPFGRVVIEAMARAKTVLATNIGGPAEIIKNGQTGWLFEHGSSTDLARQLDMILSLGEKERRRVEDTGRNWVLNNLKPEKIAHQHVAVYRELLARTSTRSST